MPDPTPTDNNEPPEASVSRLASRAGLVTAGNLAFAALGFVSNWLLAQALGEVRFAVIARSLAAFAIAQELLGKSLSWALVRIAAKRARERGGSAVAEVIATTRRLHTWFGLLMFVVYAPLALLAAPWAQDAMPGEWAALLAAGVSAFLTNYWWHALAVTQMREDWLGYSLLTVGSGVVRLCGYALLYAGGALTVESAVMAHVATSAVTALGALWFAERRIAARGVRAADEPVLRRLLTRYARPVIVATTLGTCAAQIDVFLVGLFRANAAVSQFRVASLINTALELAVVAVIVVLTPGAARAVTRTERRASLLRSVWLAGFVGVLALATWPLARMIVSVFGPGYEPAAELYVVLLWGTVLNALTHPLSVSFFAEDRPGRFVSLHGVSLLFVVVADLLVLPEYGGLGAAWVRVAMRALQAVWILVYVALDLRRPS